MSSEVDYTIEGKEESVEPVFAQKQEFVAGCYKYYCTKAAEVRLETTTTTTNRLQQGNVDNPKEGLTNMRQFKDFITNCDNTVPIYPLLITVSGLPKSGKRTSLRKAFKVDSTKDTRFSHHELVTTGFRRNQQSKTLTVNRDTSFLFGLESGLEYNLKEAHFPFSDHDMEDLTFTDDTLKRYLTGVSEYLQQHQKQNQKQHQNNVSEKSPSAVRRRISNISSETTTYTFDMNNQVTHPSDCKSPKKNPHEHNLQESECMLMTHGVGFVNIWDTSLNKTIRPFLESCGSFFTRSILWLFIDLERDLPKLHEPPEDIETDHKALRMRSRIEYLLRQCQMCKHSQYTKGGKKRVCTIFATYSSLSTPAPEKGAKELRLECEEAARQMGVDHLIDFDIVLVDKEKETAKPLRAKLKMCFEQVEPKQVPLSWILLRGSFLDHKSFYIKYSDLQQKAKECRLPAEGGHNLDEFLEFYSSFGSIFDLRQFDQSLEYVIIKPLEFLLRTDSFQRSAKDENGIISTDALSPDEHAMLEIMASVSLAVKLPVVTPNALNSRFYFPSIRKGDRKTSITPGTIQFVLSMATLRINHEAEIIKLLLTALPNAELSPSEWTNSVLITTHKNEEKPHYIEIFLSFQGDVIEISFGGMDSMAEMAEIDSLVETVVSMFKQMIAQKKHLTDIRYHFAIRCEQDEYDDTTTFHPYHKRHVLPNTTLCEKCSHIIEHTQHKIIEAWNKTLKNNSTDDAMKLNGDLSPTDIQKVLDEVGKYPIEAIHLLAKELKVENYFEEQKIQRSMMWLLLGMIDEWQKEAYKEDESPKKVLARCLVAVDEKWMQSTNSEPLTDDEEHNFTKLARKIDMQVVTSSIKRRYFRNKR